jgi:hypothetical protein
MKLTVMLSGDMKFTRRFQLVDKVNNALNALEGTGLVCQECGSQLTLMHTGYNASCNNLEVDLLFHCERCHRDWVQTSVFTLQSSIIERKFWG